MGESDAEPPPASVAEPASVHEPAPVIPVKRAVLLADCRVVVPNCGVAHLKAGKILDSRYFDLERLESQGARLRMLDE